MPTPGSDGPFDVRMVLIELLFDRGEIIRRISYTDAAVDKTLPRRHVRTDDSVAGPEVTIRNVDTTTHASCDALHDLIEDVVMLNKLIPHR